VKTVDTEGLTMQNVSASNENQRIAELETALSECIAMLRAMPPNPVVWGQTKKAQAVLDSKPIHQPLFGMTVFPVREDSAPKESRLYLEAFLPPHAHHVEIRAAGNWKEQSRLLELAFTTLGIRIHLQPNQERARSWHEGIAEAKRRYYGPEDTMNNVGGTAHIPR
jgi:hypothetical protein